MKNVQITQELFYYLIKYHLLDQQENQEHIKKLLSDKLDSIAKRELYTTYKTANTEEEREKARVKYLDMIGMHKDFRY